MQKRVLVVEDEALLAYDHKMIIEEMGFEVVGPADTVTRGLELAEEDLSGAVIDVKLDAPIEPLLDRLVERGIPMILVTGVTHDEVPERFASFPFVSKPVDHNVFRAQISVMLGSSNL